jgi:glutaredoxin
MVSTDSSAQTLPNSSASRKIVVYTTNGCRKCNTLKEWLKRANRYFEERSLEDINVMTELVMKDIVVLSAPVLEVNNSIYAETQFFDGDALSSNRLQEIIEGNR